MVKFQYTADHANQVTSVVYVISGLISALLGAFIDRYGRNEIFVLISASGSILGQILLVYTKVNPYIGTILMGLSYSLMATSVWPMVALVIPEHQLGTAYGMQVYRPAWLLVMVLFYLHYLGCNSGFGIVMEVTENIFYG